MSRHFASASVLAAGLLTAAVPAYAAQPSPFQGLWCGTGLLHEFTLRLVPAGSREVDATLLRRGRVRELHGNVEGNTLRSQATKHGRLVLSAIGSELRIVDGEGALALVKGSSFRRGGANGCS